MKYATYSLYFPSETPQEGFAPHVTIRAAGKFIENAFFIDSKNLVCYVDDSVDASELSQWDFTIITQEKALQLAKNINLESYLKENNEIVMPHTPPYIPQQS
jgi:hypothetical protein